jgi:hypothetical protein
MKSENRSHTSYAKLSWHLRAAQSMLREQVQWTTRHTGIVNYEQQDNLSPSRIQACYEQVIIAPSHSSIKVRIEALVIKLLVLSKTSMVQPGENESIT